MKIAFTGSSSTGKTTLAKRLMESQQFIGLVGEFITEDARSLLKSLGHASVDDMSRKEMRKFQECYFEQKSVNEANRENYLVDRSFVDVAAYWLIRDGFDLPLSKQKEFEGKCRKLAENYDLHIHFPFGQIPFDSDGYRSEDQGFHSRIAEKIYDLLQDWGLKFISIESSDLELRLQQVLLASSDASLDESSKTK